MSVQREVTVPPNSVARLTCKMNTQMKEDYFIEPVDDLKVLKPRTVCSAETEPIICLMNPADSLRTLTSGTVISSAYEVMPVQEEDIQFNDSCSTK